MLVQHAGHDESGPQADEPAAVGLVLPAELGEGEGALDLFKWCGCVCMCVNMYVDTYI